MPTLRTETGPRPRAQPGASSSLRSIRGEVMQGGWGPSVPNGLLGKRGVGMAFIRQKKYASKSSQVRQGPPSRGIDATAGARIPLPSLTLCLRASPAPPEGRENHG